MNGATLPMNAPAVPGLNAMPISAEQMRDQVNAIQRLMEAVMKEGEHYGVIPGSRKPSLWKPGAEKLCVAFHIAPSFVIEDLSSADRYRYRVKCIGTHQQSGIKLGEGMGSCCSMEQKFKWRNATDAEFDNTPAKRRRFKYRFDKDTLRPYEVKQVRAERDDIENTILKMACKRAHVAMTLNVTAASDIFTQDIEDLPEHLLSEIETSQTPKPVQALKEPQPKSKKPKKKEEAAPPSQKQEPAQPESVAPPRPDGVAILSEGQRRILRVRMKRADVSDSELMQKFGVPLEGIPAAKFNDVAAWVREIGGSRHENRV